MGVESSDSLEYRLIARLPEDYVSYDNNVPHDDFSAGFEAGYRAIRGTNVMLPMEPMEPMTKMNMTRFLMGVRKGIERAGIELG